MPKSLTATRRALPIVLDQGPHSERLLWIGCLALDFCRGGCHENGDSLLLCLELTERVHRRAAELREALQGHRVLVSV
jgi:hypothetical protein